MKHRRTRLSRAEIDTEEAAELAPFSWIAPTSDPVALKEALEKVLCSDGSRFTPLGVFAGQLAVGSQEQQLNGNTGKPLFEVVPEHGFTFNDPAAIAHTWEQVQLGVGPSSQTKMSRLLVMLARLNTQIKPSHRTPEEQEFQKLLAQLTI